VFTLGTRLELQSLLEETLESSNVYFQSPPNIGMVYPCVVYKLDDANTVFADNTPYRITDRYLVTVIDRDPDSVIPKKVGMLPMCVRQRTYVANNLNHSVYVLYF
jgi:hypothetical protein